jgi:hypothetical protein
MNRGVKYGAWRPRRPAHFMPIINAHCQSQPRLLPNGRDSPSGHSLGMPEPVVGDDGPDVDDGSLPALADLPVLRALGVEDLLGPVLGDELVLGGVLVAPLGPGSPLAFQGRGAVALLLGHGEALLLQLAAGLVALLPEDEVRRGQEAIAHHGPVTLHEAHYLSASLDAQVRLLFQFPHAQDLIPLHFLGARQLVEILPYG